MATYLQVVNRLEARLRAPASTNTASLDTYPALLAVFIDDAMRDWCDMFPWQRYRSIISVNTADDDDVLDLANSTTQRTRVLRVWNTDSSDPLYVESMDVILRNQLATSPTKGSITAYHWGGADSTDGTARIHLYPRAEGVQAIKVWLYNPPADLAGSASATFVNAPEHVIEMGAYMKALIERGEDGGTPFAIAKMDYDRAITNLMSYESQVAGMFDWDSE